ARSSRPVARAHQRGVARTPAPVRRAHAGGRRRAAADLPARRSVARAVGRRHPGAGRARPAALHLVRPRRTGRPGQLRQPDAPGAGRAGLRDAVGGRRRRAGGTGAGGAAVVPLVTGDWRRGSVAPRATLRNARSTTMLRSRKMARPRGFDKGEVVAHAAYMISLKGYGATSLRDLITHLGLSSSCIYAAFDGKYGLFMAALEHGAAQDRAMIVAALDHPAGMMAGITALYDGLIDSLVAEEPAAASLTLRAALEHLENDGQGAQAAGQPPEAREPDVLAALRVHLARSEER